MPFPLFFLPSRKIPFLGIQDESASLLLPQRLPLAIVHRSRLPDLSRGGDGETELSAEVAFPTSPHTQRAAILMVTKIVPSPPLRKTPSRCWSGPGFFRRCFYVCYPQYRHQQQNAFHPVVSEPHSDNVVNRTYVTRHRTTSLTVRTLGPKSQLRPLFRLRDQQKG